MYDEKMSECHLLLRGGRNEDYKNSDFCSSDMESLTSLCEVILQPLPLNSLDHDDDDHHHSQKMKESIQLFSTLSASQYPIPNKV